jgi:hypothetical protein
VGVGRVLVVVVVGVVVVVLLAELITFVFSVTPVAMTLLFSLLREFIGDGSFDCH